MLGLKPAMTNSICQICLFCFGKLVFLKHLANIPAIPESVSKQIVKEIEDYAENVQKSLLESSKKDLSGSLKQIILDIKINNI